MDWQEFLDRFEFHNELVFNDKVYAVATIQLNAFVRNWKRALTLKSDTRKTQLATETFLISRLEQPWAEGFVNLYAGPNDPLGQLVDFHVTRSAYTLSASAPLR